ncbi:hypothetical protein M436DRAFT_67779 [Aureobasidium namibiae CBS 147.97]|uniref:MFS general substrate transporter n=1 Tax=Aureobasidium namibiae CBS 147.97 TaxID=1043004 RepID=A0A074W6V7_9PEZI|nr:uncharacterized protein M436DRAFT_67779 [Aureobasidium namibiae CBS 147.97]KEQ68865.1 hypothetical protein M436DRAFT_67779 [Aureobasidium namibiae CBS 147.97]
MPGSMANIVLTTVTPPRPGNVISENADKSPSSPFDTENDIKNSELSGQELASTDGGPAAWRLLVAAFAFEALLWVFAGNRYISVVGTAASGLGYLGAPIIVPYVQSHQHRQPICILGLIAGSFASNLGILILTQGVAYGLGFLIFYYPILSMVNEYWITDRGMAYGILCGASGISGTTMPFKLQALLERYGYRITLRAVERYTMKIQG